jgi:alcohol dehydrogenase
MRALTYDGTAVHYKQFHADPRPPAGEALVQVSLAGICQTDLEIAAGYMNFRGVLGHEFVGIVKEAPDSRLIGKRVVGDINCVCGKCPMCQRGLSSHCPNRTVLGIEKRAGAFADLLTLPATNLHVVPDGVSDEQAVFTEPLAAAIQILRQVQIDARTKVAVLGDGRLGHLTVQVMATTGCNPMLIGRHPEKLEVAEKAGIRTALDSAFTAFRDLDVVIDCTGRSAGLQRAIELVRPRGTIVLKTTVADPTPLHLARLVIDEITLLGSRCGPFPMALQMLAKRQVQVDGLITKRVKIAAAETLFAARSLPGLKTLIVFDR